MDLGGFWWMVWNGILALVPALLAVVLFKREEQPRRGLRNFTFFFEVGLVMLILPNAPYVATDLIHFLETVRLSDASLWRLLGTEFPVYITLMVFGLLCYSFTVDRLLYALGMRLGKGWRWAGWLAIPLLAAIGIYLGRVARFNSWDILSDPRAILQSSRVAIDRLRVLKVVGFMWILLIVVHQVYKVFHDGVRYRMEQFRLKREGQSELSRQGAGTAPVRRTFVARADSISHNISITRGQTDPASTRHS